MKIADTIKILKLIPPQVPLADTVEIQWVKEVLTGTILLRVDKRINTKNNIHYTPTLLPKLPSTPVTNKYKTVAANTVYDRIQQSIEYFKEKYEKNKMKLQHIELFIITTPQQHHQCQFPIHTNTQKTIIWWHNIYYRIISTKSMTKQENTKQRIH